MWEVIDKNIGRSRVLIFMMGALLLALGFGMGAAVDIERGGLIGMASAAIVWFILWLIAFFQGDSLLLGSVGAYEIGPEHHPQLWNVVEEMKIAAGLPKMPRVFLIEDSTPNAFAVGRKPEVSAVAVTSGLLARLDRDELQGVVAHEIGHIYNYDIRFMTMASVMLGSIVMISDMFLRGLRHATPRRSSSKDNGGGQIVILLLVILFAILAPIFAQMLYFACSRRREFLADAMAARFTRYPEGLASALERIEGSASGMRSVNRAVAPLYIINPLQGRAAVGRLSTHPPTTQRVKVLREMSGGAGYVQYDAAFRRVVGGARHVIGSKSLASADSVAVREASPRPVTPEEKREAAIGRAKEVGNLLGMIGMFVPMMCECGVRISVPEGYRRKEIACPRCGTLHQVPHAESAETAASNLEPVVRDASAGMVYTRNGGGGWEAFQCACGGTVQLSPTFQGERVVCPKCQNRIEIRT